MKTLPVFISQISDDITKQFLMIELSSDSYNMVLYYSILTRVIFWCH